MNPEKTPGECGCGEEALPNNTVCWACYDALFDQECGFTADDDYMIEMANYEQGCDSDED